MTDVISLPDDCLVSTNITPVKVYKFNPKDDITLQEVVEVLKLMNIGIFGEDWFNKLSPEAKRHWSEGDAY